MTLLEVVTKALRKNQAQIDVPDGYCPNCWGKQEYGGQFFEAIKNENVDINAVNEKKGWILDYAEKHLFSIRLQPKDDMLVCQVCKLTYRPEQVT